MFSEYRDYKLFFIYIYDPLIFDLMTLKYNQIHDQGLAVIHQIGSWERDHELFLHT